MLHDGLVYSVRLLRHGLGDTRVNAWLQSFSSLQFYSHIPNTVWTHCYITKTACDSRLRGIFSGRGPRETCQKEMSFFESQVMEQHVIRFMSDLTALMPV